VLPIKGTDDADAHKSNIVHTVDAAKQEMKELVLLEYLQ
jgi:hypothetical protein